jgi:SAM-dependent methyltransferase
MRSTLPDPAALDLSIRAYWNERIHDAEVGRHPAGSAGFFRDLDAYRFGKLDYLPRVVSFDGWAGRCVLEVGCGAGIDLVRFARGAALVTGVEVSRTALSLARRNLEVNGLHGCLTLADGTALPFRDGAFDLAYCHSVFPFARDPHAMVEEMHRVLRPGGQAVLMVYNRNSWIAWLSRGFRVRLGHADAPVFHVSSRAELESLAAVFGSYRIVAERFPVPTRLHHGWKATLFNRLFVPGFRLVRGPWFRPFGWHLLAFCTKAA